MGLTNPFVVELVEVLVDERVVLVAMNQVDAKVGEDKEGEACEGNESVAPSAAAPVHKNTTEKQARRVSGGHYHKLLSGAKAATHQGPSSTLLYILLRPWQSPTNHGTVRSVSQAVQRNVGPQSRSARRQPEESWSPLTKGDEGGLDFEADLVFQETRMLHQAVVDWQTEPKGEPRDTSWEAGVDTHRGSSKRIQQG